MESPDDICAAIARLSAWDRVVVVRAVLGWATTWADRPALREALEIASDRGRWYEGRWVFESARASLLAQARKGELAADDEHLLLLTENAGKAIANADGSGRYDQDVTEAAVSIALSYAESVGPTAESELRKAISGAIGRVSQG